MIDTSLRFLCVLGLTAGLAFVGSGCATGGGGGGGGGDDAMDGGGGDDDGAGDDNGTGNDGMDDVIAGAGLNFTAMLTGGNERPDQVETDTTGSASVVTNEAMDEFSYTIDVENGVNVSAAHIHEGGPEDAGGVVVGLFSGGEASVNGQLVQGTITAADLSGSLAGGTIADLIELIESGNAYVNVHTDANPGGEVRGQLVLGG